MIVLQTMALLLVVVAMISIIFSTLRLGISPMPTNSKVRDAVLAFVPTDLTGDLHELGAGWGTLAFPLARRCPNARVIAWEASPIPYLFLWIRKSLTGTHNLMLRRADFHDADLRGARLVTAYLFTGAMTRLGPKFDAELQPGTRVISHTFAWRGRQPTQSMQVDDLFHTPVYLYVI